jgi:hypothetical protein
MIYLFLLRECSIIFKGVRNALFQTVFIVSCRHFSHILPTWFLVFITAKYPMVETHLWLISCWNFSFSFF